MEARAKPIIHLIVSVCQATGFSRFDFPTKRNPSSIPFSTILLKPQYACCELEATIGSWNKIFLKAYLIKG
jgi:hypothetical protein